MAEIRRDVRADRIIGGYVKLTVREYHGSLLLTLAEFAVSEKQAIRLCDMLREILGHATRAEPSGENVVVMEVTNG